MLQDNDRLRVDTWQRVAEATISAAGVSEPADDPKRFCSHSPALQTHQVPAQELAGVGVLSGPPRVQAFSNGLVVGFAVVAWKLEQQVVRSEAQLLEVLEQAVPLQGLFLQDSPYVALAAAVRAAAATAALGPELMVAEQSAVQELAGMFDETLAAAVLAFAAATEPVVVAFSLFSSQYSQQAAVTSF